MDAESANGGATTRPYREVSQILGVAILFAPGLFVWWLLRPGYSPTARWLGFAWLLFGWAIWAFVYLVMWAPAPQAPRPPPVALAAPASPAPSKAALRPHGGSLTLAAYRQIHIGMTHAEVARILGGPGVETYSSVNAGGSSAMVEWLAADGNGAVSAGFLDGRLILLQQANLK